MSALRQAFPLLIERAYSSSDFYRALCQMLCRDDELLARLEPIPRPATQKAALLLAAVQWLLSVEAKQHPLGYWYQASAAGWSPTWPEETAGLYQAFRAFCDQFWPQIVQLIEDRQVQYNDPSRAALLLPALGYMSRWAKGLPLFLIEAGASAGFNLHYDSYAYLYLQPHGQVIHYGSASASVHLTCRVSGIPLPLIPGTFLPPVHKRLGIDLAPLCVQDAHDQAWILSFLHPDAHTVRARVQASIQAAKKQEIPFIAGDALEVLPDLISSEKHCFTVIFISFVLWQWTAAQRTRLSELLARSATSKRFAVITLDRPAFCEGKITPVCLSATHYQPDGDQQCIQLGTCDATGARLHWCPEEGEYGGLPPLVEGSSAWPR